MKKVMTGLMAVLMTLGIIPAVLAVGVGYGTGISVETENFVPLIWLCDNRIVYDDYNEPGAVDEVELVERIENYAFEGEQICWEVLVMDKNGINKIEDVYGTIGTTQGVGNDIEVNCVEDLNWEYIVVDECNARIGEEDLTGEGIVPATQRYYRCCLTIETPASMYGEYWITVEVTDLDGLSAIIDENEYWFLNPVIALSVEGSIDFGSVRPGTLAYSETLLVGNDADAGSGVLLDMWISGTDFYDGSSSGAMCPTSNVLKLTNLAYYATNGAYGTYMDAVGPFTADAEGYVGIPYEVDGAGDPGNNNRERIIDQAVALAFGVYPAGNVLSPGAELALTFRLSLPEPCNGDFSDGTIYF